MDGGSARRDWEASFSTVDGVNRGLVGDCSVSLVGVVTVGIGSRSGVVDSGCVRLEEEVLIIAEDGDEDRTGGEISEPPGDELGARLEQRVTTTVIERTDIAKGLEGKHE